MVTVASKETIGPESTDLALVEKRPNYLDLLLMPKYL